MTDSTAPPAGGGQKGGRGEMLIFISEHESSVSVWFVLFL